MAFKDILYNSIKESSLSLREIANRCMEKGVSITPSYISQLQNGKMNPPSEEICSVLADVLDIDKSIFILEAYLDNAPSILNDFLINIRNTLHPIQSAKNDNKLIDKIYKNQPISKFILDFNSTTFTNKISITGSIPIEDDSMEPLIPEGSQIVISKFVENPKKVFKCGHSGGEYDEKYFEAAKTFYNDQIGFLYAEDGDIIAAWDLDENKLLVRTYQDITDDDLSYFLMPMNGKYKIRVGNLFNTYFNLVHIENQKTILNTEIINILNRKHKVMIDGKEVLINDGPLGICILGKVSKVILPMK